MIVSDRWFGRGESEIGRARVPREREGGRARESATLGRVAALVGGTHLGEPRQTVPNLGDHEKVNGRLGTNVSEGQALVILVDNVRGNLLAYDLVEDCWLPFIGHRFLRRGLFVPSHRKGSPRGSSCKPLDLGSVPPYCPCRNGATSAHERGRLRPDPCCCAEETHPLCRSVWSRLSDK